MCDFYTKGQVQQITAQQSGTLPAKGESIAIDLPIPVPGQKLLISALSAELSISPENSAYAPNSYFYVRPQNASAPQDSLTNWDFSNHGVCLNGAEINGFVLTNQSVFQIFASGTLGSPVLIDSTQKVSLIIFADVNSAGQAYTVTIYAQVVSCQD